MVSTPACVPAAVGLKATVMAQLSPGAMVAGQSLAWEKAPPALTLPICSIALPVLVSVTVWVPLPPTCTLPKFMLAQERTIAGDCSITEIVLDADEASATSML